MPGADLAVEEFSSLAHTLELAVGARVILMHNLAVEHGLMNGRQGVVRQIVYAQREGPTSDDVSERMPKVVVVQFAEYVGPAFYSDPARREWVPLMPLTRDAEHRPGVSRTQFPLVLGWAITPWKAQGMTLERVVVRLGKAGASPGVAFVALSRVRHPDDLMLDDSFPDMATIMRQAQKPAFIQRQQWERMARVRFSRTVRRFMRDPAWFERDRLWTDSMSAVADCLLGHVRVHPRLDDTALLASAIAHFPAEDPVELERVWVRMQGFPHIFEVANASAT